MGRKVSPLTRRDFLRGTLGATLGASIIGPKFLRAGEKAVGQSLVTVVRDENAMDASNTVNKDILKDMLDQTIIKVTGQNSAEDAWLSLVKPEDTIGLVDTPHLNPTHPEVVEAVKNALIAAGIPEEKIIKAQGGPDKPRPEPARP